MNVTSTSTGDLGLPLSSMEALADLMRDEDKVDKLKTQMAACAPPKQESFMRKFLHKVLTPDVIRHAYHIFPEK